MEHLLTVITSTCSKVDLPSMKSSGNEVCFTVFFSGVSSMSHSLKQFLFNPFLPLSPNLPRGVLSSPAWRALPHTVTALTGAVLMGSRSNLVGTNLGAGSRTSSFMGDEAR